MGFYNLCKYGADIENENQRIFFYNVSKFFLKIPAFIDAYVKANSQKK
jgi:hypothetical protein